MPFFPDSVYGLAYLAALLVAGFVTMLGRNTQARRVLYILIAHWVTTRLIDVYDHENFTLWLAQDWAVFGALLICRGGRTALACATLFFVVMTFDSYSYIANGSFEGAAAVAETVGYLAMIIMAGGAHADFGKRRGNSGDLRSGNAGLLDTYQGWLQAKRRSGGHL